MGLLNAKGKFYITLLILVNICIGGMFHAMLYFRVQIQSKINAAQTPCGPTQTIRLRSDEIELNKETRSYLAKSPFVYVDVDEDSNVSLTLESTQWAPIAITKCAAGMPRYWAPCIQMMNPQYVLFAEELLFPDYIIKYPKFPNSSKRNYSAEDQLEFLLWDLRKREDIRERNVAVFNDSMVYRGQRAQNFVFVNATYAADPWPNSWKPKGCMGKETDFRDLAAGRMVYTLGKAQALTKRVKSAIPVIGPNNMKYQHFLDRGTHVLEQAAHLYNEDTKVITVESKDAIVANMIESYFGFKGNDTYISHSGFGVHAERMVFSCRALLLHPWYALRFQERFGVDRHVRYETRKKILYLSRKGLTRPLLNEDDLVTSLRNYVKQRNHDEVVLLLTDVQEKYPDLGEFVRWMNHNVLALIGPHGGAFYNHRLLPQNSLILEIMPRTRIFSGLWEESSFLDQHYYMFLAETSEKGDKTTLAREDISAIVGVLDSFLKKNDHSSLEMVESKRVAFSYDWNIKPKGVRFSPDSSFDSVMDAPAKESKSVPPPASTKSAYSLLSTHRRRRRRPAKKMG